MKTSLKFGVGITIVMIIIGGSLLVASLNSQSKTNQSNEVSKNVQSKNSETNLEENVNQSKKSMSVLDESVDELESVVPNNPQGSVIEGNTEDRINNVNSDRTNNTEAAKVVKAYYQSIGQDNDNLTYTGYQKGDGYEVRVVDIMIQKQGGSGTVDLLNVDKNNNVSHVN